MATTPAAQRLRERALALEALAGRLHRLSVLSLHLAAGPSTWVGPSPQACLDDLRASRGRLQQQVEELVQEARRFNRIADDMDAAAAATGVH